MRIIVSDTSCLIDLRIGQLLAALFALPFEVQLALPLARDELSIFTEADWQQLAAQGLKIVDLDGKLVARALVLKREHRRLSAYDALTLALAESEKHSVLLTSDRALRNAATTVAIEAHGILWIIDKLVEARLLSAADLLAALKRPEADPLVYLPVEELKNRIGKLARY